MDMTWDSDPSDQKPYDGRTPDLVQRQLDAAEAHRAAGGRLDDPPCVFCPPNWDNLDIVEQPIPQFAIINPLDPVTPGHVLVIFKQHTVDAADDPQVAADCVFIASEYIAQQGIQANIITSIGRHATQSVMHTHVHIVPRRENDGLPLPWTPQHEVRSLREATHLKQMLQESGGDWSSVGLFQQSPPIGTRQFVTGRPDAVSYWPTKLAEGLGYDDE